MYKCEFCASEWVRDMMWCKCSCYNITWYVPRPCDISINNVSKHALWGRNRPHSLWDKTCKSFFRFTKEVYILHHCLFHLRYYAKVDRRNKLGWFNIKRLSYQCRKSQCGDKTVLRPSNLQNGISYTGKIISVYSSRSQVVWIDMYFMELMCALPS